MRDTPRSSVRFSRVRTILSGAWLTAALLLCASPAAQASHGDADGDGKVTIEDARLVSNFLVGNVPSLPNSQDADVNRDGKITIADALLILQLVKGLRTSFDSQSPQALAVLPANGATGVLLTANVSVFFSEPISTTSLAGTLTLTDTVTNQLVPGRLECSQDGVIETFFPDQPLSPTRTYRVNVTTGIKDLEGNALQKAFTSAFETQVVGSLLLVSVNNPSGLINSLLPEAITVRALSASGSPVRQVSVVFTARMGAGTFQPSGQRQVTDMTDDNGLASASLQVGGQAVEHTVEIMAIGFMPSLVFRAQAVTAKAKSLRIFAGNNQNCPTGATALLPLQVKAADEGGNAVSGTTVTFRVQDGDGNFSGLSSSQTVTNSSGVASAAFSHGTSPGVVLVNAFFDGMVGQPPVFTLVGQEPRPSSPTAIIGAVINTEVKPLKGIKVFLVSSPTVQNVTDESGSFRLEPVPPGKQLFVIDALDSGPIDGEIYANLEFEINVIQGRDNTIQMPAILPELDPQSFVDVSDVQGGILALRANPLWKLFLAPGQTTFPGGGHTGRIFVTVVPFDKIPMAPPEGKLSRMFVAIEPPLVRFSPPADVQFPNADNLAAGTVTEIFSFDHTVGLFVPVGKGQVSEDRTVIRSLPGQGLIHGGWHQSPDPVQRQVCCIGGVLKIGRDDLPPEVTIAGIATIAREIGRTEKDIQVAFELCNVPADLGPVDVTINVPSERNAGPAVGPPGGPPIPPFGDPGDQNGCSDPAPDDAVSLSVDPEKLPIRFGSPSEDILVVQVNRSAVKVKLEFDKPAIVKSPLDCRPRQPSGFTCTVCTDAAGVKRVRVLPFALGTIQVTASVGRIPSAPVLLSVVPDVRFVDRDKNGNDFDKGAFDRAEHNSAVGVAAGQQNTFFARVRPTNAEVTYTLPLAGAEKAAEQDPGLTKFTLTPALGVGGHSVQAQFMAEPIEKIKMESFPPAQNTTPADRPIKLAVHIVDGNVPACGPPGCAASQVSREANDIMQRQANITITQVSEDTVAAKGLGSGVVDAAARRSILEAARDMGRLGGDINVFYVKALSVKGESVCGTQVVIELGGVFFNTIWTPTDLNSANCGAATVENLGQTLAHEVGHALNYEDPDIPVVPGREQFHAADSYRLMFENKTGNIIPPKDAARLRRGVEAFTP